MNNLRQSSFKMPVIISSKFRTKVVFRWGLADELTTADGTTFIKPVCTHCAMCIPVWRWPNIYATMISKACSMLPTPSRRHATEPCACAEDIHRACVLRLCLHSVTDHNLWLFWISDFVTPFAGMYFIYCNIYISHVLQNPLDYDDMRCMILYRS